MNIKLFFATKAFVSHRGKILILKESSRYADGSNIGKFDVAGGRIKPGENWRDVLLREVKEETGLDVEIGRPFAVDEWRPIVRSEKWQVVAVFFECFSKTGKVILSQDHDKYLWIKPADYKKYPIIKMYDRTFGEYLEFLKFKKRK